MELKNDSFYYYDIIDADEKCLRGSFQITGAAINLTVGYNHCVESLPVLDMPTHKEPRVPPLEKEKKYI
jgi:hypothetical protein